MRDDLGLLWLALGVCVLSLLGVFVSGWLLDRAAAPGEAAIAAKVQATKEANPNWPWTVIDTGMIRLGMSEAMVLAALGDPDVTNESVGAWGSDEQWVYASHDDPGDVTSWSHLLEGIDHRATHRYKYVYFENGILTSWSD